MRILHLSSFTGNIGDNLSNIGTYNILNRFIDYTVDELEIRKFYRGGKKFDYDFVELANRYDLLLIGGGAFFDYFIDESVNGTTFNITEIMLELLTPEIVVISMGCLPRGHDHNLPKVQKFVERLQDRAKVFFRNDGSVKNFPDVPEVLDSGYFFEDKWQGGDYVAVNVGTYELTDTDNYINELAEHIVGTDEKFVFVPHALVDLKTIATILELLPTLEVAKRITVAPYQQGWDGLELFDYYKYCKRAICTRYHGLIYCQVAGVPVTSINVSPKVEYIYNKEPDFNKTLDYYKECFSGPR